MGGFRQAAPTGVIQQPTEIAAAQLANQSHNQSLPLPSAPEDDEEPGSPMHQSNNQTNNTVPASHMVRIHDDPEHEPGVIHHAHDPSNGHDHHIDVEFVPHNQQHQRVNNYNHTVDQPIQPATSHTQANNQPKSVNLRDIRAQHGVPKQSNAQTNNQAQNKRFFGRKQSNGHQGVQMVPVVTHQAHVPGSNIHTIDHNANHTHSHQQPPNRVRRKSHPREEEFDPSINRSMPFPAPMFSRTRRSLIPNVKILAITNLIMLACIVMMIVELVIGADKYDGAFVDTNPMGGPSVKTLYRLGGKWEPSIRNDGEGWRLLSAVWLHSGLLHLAMNLLTLAVIGYTSEQRFTWPIYLIIYLAAGVLGNFWSCVTYASSVGVGASGAIFGVIGAQLAHLLYNYSLIENAFAELIMLVIVAVVGICLGFISQVSSNMDTYAHLGGFLTGIALGFAITPFPRKRHIIIEGAVRIAGLLGTVALFLIFSLLLFIGDPKGPENVTNL